jgi:sialic acid synthase SpsE
MISRAKEARSDWVKFQYFDVPSLKAPPELAEKLNQVALSLDDLVFLKEHAEKEGIGFICTAMKLVRVLKEYVRVVKPTILKIREADGRNNTFVNAAAKTGLPLLISVDPRKGPYIRPNKNTSLLYCIPKYPPRTADFNHESARTYSGFSNHYPHTTFAKRAVREARGNGMPVYWLEVHVLSYHGYKCLDEKVSVDFNELAEITSYSHRERV